MVQDDPVVSSDAVAEAILRKLHGINRIPIDEQERMIHRAVLAGRDAAQKEHAARIAELELFTRAAGTSLANANDRIAELEQQLAAAQERERRLHDLLVEAAVEFRRIGWEVTAECLTDKADEITCAKE